MSLALSPFLSFFAVQWTEAGGKNLGCVFFSTHFFLDGAALHLSVSFDSRFQTEAEEKNVLLCCVGSASSSSSSSLCLQVSLFWWVFGCGWNRWGRGKKREERFMDLIFLCVFACRKVAFIHD